MTKLDIEFLPAAPEIILLKPVMPASARFSARTDKMSILPAICAVKRCECRAPRPTNTQFNLLRGTVVALATLAVLAVAGCKPSGGGAGQYETAPVTRGEIVQHVTASGTLSAVVSVDVGSQVSGKIVALTVDFNSPVEERPGHRGD